MINLFTAVGKYQILYLSEYEKKAIFESQNGKFILSYDEIILWKELLWNIYDFEELKKFFYKAKHKLHSPLESDVETLVSMLEDKGLIISGSGITRSDACYHLIADRSLLSAHDSFPQLISAFITLTFIKKNPISLTRHIFDRIPMSNIERYIYRLSKKPPVTTADIINKLDNHTYSVNPAINAFISVKKIIVVDAVVKLYQNNMIMFG